jgi:hypothetical protein
LGGDSRNLFLGVVQVPSRLASSIHSVGEIGARAFDAALCESLQFEELTLFGVKLAGSEKVSVTTLDKGALEIATGPDSGRGLKDWPSIRGHSTRGG